MIGVIPMFNLCGEPRSYGINKVVKESKTDEPTGNRDVSLPFSGDYVGCKHRRRY